jgi:hypothetical protein
MSGIGGLNLQGVSVSPRFIFGVNGKIRNSLYRVDEHKLMYVAGHNVCVYSTDEKNQYFLEGSEGVEKITAVAMSPSKRYVAICQRAAKAKCIIYDIHTQKLKQTLPDQDIETDDYEAMDFLSASFPVKNENTQMITLTGAPDWMVLLWDIDNIKVLSKINIGLSGFTAQINAKGGVAEEEPDHNLMCSYNPLELTGEPSRVIVTGNDTFYMFKIVDDQLETELTQVNNKDREITTRYSCHGWTNDGMLILATEEGEIIVCEGSGQYEGYVSLPPGYDGKIDAILTADFPRGFIISTEGMLQPYEKDDNEDVGQPYRPMTANPMKVHDAANKAADMFVGPAAGKNINSMCLSVSGEQIYYVTENQ